MWGFTRDRAKLDATLSPPLPPQVLCSLERRLPVPITPKLGDGPCEDTSLSHTTRHGHWDHAPGEEAKHTVNLSVFAMYTRPTRVLHSRWEAEVFWD
jgi:hypothetical protein